MTFRFVRPLAVAALIGVSLAGCAKSVPPAVGTWKGTAQQGNATLTLTADGKGTLSVPILPQLQNAALTWAADSQDPKKVNITLGNGAKAGSATAGRTLSFPAIVADDNKSIALAFPQITVNLTRDESAK